MRDDARSSHESMLVSILVAQSMKAGATVEQLARATKRPQREIRQMLENVEQLERLLDHEFSPQAKVLDGEN